MIRRAGPPELSRTTALRAQRTPEGLCLLFKRPFGTTCDPNDYLIEVGADCRGLGGAVLTSWSSTGPLAPERGSQGQPGRDKAAWEKPALLSASDPMNKRALG